MIPQTKAEAAVQYAKKGFYVLPMFGKTPAIKFAHRQPLSLDQVKEYWQKNPNYNIGLRTVQFFVVDVDTDADDHMVDIVNLCAHLRQDSAHLFPVDD